MMIAIDRYRSCASFIFLLKLMFLHIISRRHHGCFGRLHFFFLLSIAMLAPRYSKAMTWLQRFCYIPPVCSVSLSWRSRVSGFFQQIRTSFRRQSESVQKSWIISILGRYYRVVSVADYFHFSVPIPRSLPFTSLIISSTMTLNNVGPRSSPCPIPVETGIFFAKLFLAFMKVTSRHSAHC